MKLNNNKITETAILAADSKKDVKKQGGSSNFLSTTHSNIGRLISQKIVNTTFAKFKKKIGSKTNILVTRTQHIEEIKRISSEKNNQRCSPPINDGHFHSKGKCR